MKVIIVIFQSLTSDSAGGMGALGYDIAACMHKNKHEVTLYTINKGPHHTPFPSISVLPQARFTLWLINKFISWSIISQLSGYKLQELLFDRFLSKKQLSADVLLTTFPLLPKTLRKASCNVGKIVLIPQNPDEQYIYDICMKDVKTYQLPVKNDAYIDKWRISSQQTTLRYINEIISISNITHNSYSRFKGNKTLMSFYLNRTANPSHRNILPVSDKFIFLFVAHIVILKGLQQLLAAWQRLNMPANAVLWIVGNVDKTLKDRLRELFPVNNIVWLGYQHDVDQLILKSKVVVIPSLVDNEPHTVVETLALSRPLIISDGCGSADWVHPEVPEAIFKTGDIDELGKKIKYAYDQYERFNDRFKNLYKEISGSKEKKIEWLTRVVRHVSTV